MIRSLIAVAACSILASACASTMPAQPQSAEDVTVASDRPKSDRNSRRKVAKNDSEPDEAAQAAGASQARKVGDFLVHRFSGSFRKNPITLTEEVVARDGDFLVVDYTFEDKDQALRVRARIDPVSGAVRSAVKLEKDKEVEMSLAAYDALIAETVFMADTNEGPISNEKITCLVGAEEHECEAQSYRVMIGGKSARLTVTSSASVPNRDLSGEITAEDGTLIYRAEIIEAGSTDSSDGSLAIGQ